MSVGYSLRSSGLEWDGDDLASRYAFLRRRRDEVRLDLLYYPYWLFSITGVARWRFFGEKVLETLTVVDARSGKCLRAPSFPDIHEDHVRFDGGEDSGGFSVASVCAEGRVRRAATHVAGVLKDEDEARSLAETFALAAWNRRYYLPLGPRATIHCSARSASLLHKPFWIMRPRKSPESGPGKMFVFDASTGLGGVSEYWNVVEYALNLQKGRE